MESDVAAELERLAVDQGFAGVVSIDRRDEVQFARAWGLADRAHDIRNTVATQFGIASGGKGFTALTVVRLIADGVLELGTRARSVLGDDLPLIEGTVTVEHLLAHRSGIGDYLDEGPSQDPLRYVLSVPVHELDTTEAFVPILDNRPTEFPPGARFAYSNSGYVVLALIAERASGVPFHDLVAQRVLGPAGLRDTAFLRSDELPGGAARGYLGADGLRTNVLHLPVRGNGDGGIYATVHDIHRLWGEFFAGHVVPSEWVAEMVRPRSETDDRRHRYGLGFWLHGSEDLVMLEGYDAGVSFRSVHNPATGTTHTVISNTTEGAWPIARYLDGLAAAAIRA